MTTASIIPPITAHIGGHLCGRHPRGRGAAMSTMNQRIAALRGLFEFAVISGDRSEPGPVSAMSVGPAGAAAWPARPRLGGPSRNVVV